MINPLAKASPSKQAALPIEVDEESEDEGKITPAQSKGKAHVVPKKASGKLEARKTRDALVCRLNHLHSWLFQIRAKVKELEVEHAIVMSSLTSHLLPNANQVNLTHPIPPITAS